MLAHVVVFALVAVAFALFAGVTAYLPVPYIAPERNPKNRIDDHPSAHGTELPRLPEEVLDALAKAKHDPSGKGCGPPLTKVADGGPTDADAVNAATAADAALVSTARAWNLRSAGRS